MVLRTRLQTTSTPSQFDLRTRNFLRHLSQWPMGTMTPIIQEKVVKMMFIWTTNRADQMQTFQLLLSTLHHYPQSLLMGRHGQPVGTGTEPKRIAQHLPAKKETLAHSCISMSQECQSANIRISTNLRAIIGTESRELTLRRVIKAHTVYTSTLTSQESQSLRPLVAGSLAMKYELLLRPISQAGR